MPLSSGKSNSNPFDNRLLLWYTVHIMNSRQHLNFIRTWFWSLVGGLLAVTSLGLVSWIGNFKYPDGRGSEMLFVVLVYAIWFIAGAVAMNNFIIRISKGG